MDRSSAQRIPPQGDGPTGLVANVVASVGVIGALLVAVVALVLVAAVGVGLALLILFVIGLSQALGLS